MQKRKKAAINLLISHKPLTIAPLLIMSYVLTL